jgi:phosphatidylinositol-3-phosphatase
MTRGMQGRGRPLLALGSLVVAAVCVGAVAHSGSVLAARSAGCVVPKVRGKTLRAAKKSIRRHHCRVGKITYRFSARVAKHHVVRQSPHPHLHRKRGAKVKLVVSKGPPPPPPPPPPPSGPCGSRAGGSVELTKVMWILMENKSYSSIAGNTDAGYENQIAHECGLASNYHAISHPSLPNYVALTSGSTQGITDDDDPSSHPLDVPSIYHELYPSARAYDESMPSNCDLSDADKYAVRHNPWTYYVNGKVGPQRSQCQVGDVPLGTTSSGALYHDVATGKLPRFSFVTPNPCDDMHDCGVSTGDAWLHGFVPFVLGGSDYRSGRLAVVITFDESGGGGGNQVYTAVISPYTVPGTVSSTGFSHYSLLRTTEEILHVPLIGAAKSAPSMRTAFGL